MTKATNLKKAIGGRPRTLTKPRVLSVKVEAEDLDALRSFVRWRSFRENTSISAGRAIFDALREAPSFLLFCRETKRAQGKS